ncbi:ATP-binding cassette domain-containing protein [Metabacillus sp. B2-18]|nr:ATP-binding cassette domain-containing protein [Metabacillus sp. B2-18]UGB33101.1 ATP-binding cassette domain-containing protein [Metabacillus sp. B2-18]
MNTSVLEVKGLEKKFKHFKLGPLNFTLEKGTAVALLGGNGSGKSTFFRLLMNILQTEAGTISMFGENINRIEAKNRVYW